MSNDNDKWTFDRIELPWLYGFWKEEHNRGSKPKLIKGDSNSFDADITSVAQRQNDRMNALSKCRWMVIEEWDQWWFSAAEGEWK